MFKFFGKIRQKLLLGGKNGKSNMSIGKYLKYAIGEVILVVIGILIALQINNWNESRKEQNQESNFMELLTQDLSSDAASLSELIELSDMAVASKNIILDYQENIITEPDSLSTHFLRAVFHGIESFVPNKGAIEEIKSAGGLSLIKNEEVSNQILKLYNAYDRFEKNTGQNYIANRSALRQLIFQKANGPFFNRDLGVDQEVLRTLISDDEIRDRLINNWALTYNRKLKEVEVLNSETKKICKEYLQKINK